MKIRIFAVLAVVVCLGIGLVLSNDLNRTALFNGYGQKSSGSLAGIEIGQDQRVASETFGKLGMISATYADDGSCPIKGRFDSVLVFIDTSWRYGTICVGVVNGKVASFAWRYVVFQT